MMKPLIAMVVDDNRYFLSFVTRLLADHYTDLVDVRAACKTCAAIARCVAFQPQLILLDLGLPGMTGLPFIAPLRQAAPHAAVIVLSTADEAPYAVAARRAGAIALLGKDTLNTTLRLTCVFSRSRHRPGRDILFYTRRSNGMIGTGIEILLVEDNPSDVALALHAFRKHHLANHVHVIRDGAEALEFLFGTGAHAQRDLSNGPKVILLDMKLPLVHGLEVLRQIKADPRTQPIPVVMLTSSHEERDIVESYQLGVNSYIVKPVDFEQFSDAMCALGMYWLLLNQPPIRSGAAGSTA